MAHKQVKMDTVLRRAQSGISHAIQMGTSARHFEVWHRGHTEDGVAAIWLNEVGPVAVQLPQRTQDQ